MCRLLSSEFLQWSRKVSIGQNHDRHSVTAGRSLCLNTASLVHRLSVPDWHAYKSKLQHQHDLKLQCACGVVVLAEALQVAKKRSAWTTPTTDPCNKQRQPVSLNMALLCLLLARHTRMQVRVSCMLCCKITAGHCCKQPALFRQSPGQMSYGQPGCGLLKTGEQHSVMQPY